MIFKLFEGNEKSSEINPYGIYNIKLCLDGKWIDVIIDDYFPCDQYNRPAFS